MNEMTEAEIRDRNEAEVNRVRSRPDYRSWFVYSAILVFIAVVGLSYVPTLIQYLLHSARH